REECVGQKITGVYAKDTSKGWQAGFFLYATLQTLSVFLPLVKARCPQTATAINYTLGAITLASKGFLVLRQFKHETFNAPMHYRKRWGTNGAVYQNFTNLELGNEVLGSHLSRQVEQHLTSLLDSEAGIHHHEVAKRYCLDCGEILAASN